MGLFNGKSKEEEIYDSLKTLQDLVDQKYLFEKEIDRSKIRVCVLDDEGYDIDPLYSLGFTNIDRQTEFSNINMFADKDVVLCDIEGVGQKINSQRQGLAVAEQIKRTYPNALVYAYTSKNIGDYGGESKLLDGVIRKLASTSEIVEIIERDTKRKNDVVYTWDRIRGDMIKEGCSTKAIAFLEHYYCSSLLNKINMFREYQTNYLNIDNIQKYIDIISDCVNVFLIFSGVENV